MAIGDQIRSRRLELGMTMETLAKRCGYKTKSSIQKIESGASDIPQNKIVLFSQALDCSIAYLLGLDEPRSYPTPSDSDMRYLPLIGSIACGLPILAQENIEEMIPCPEHIKADFCLRCKGDSMIGCRIMDGDIVFIQKHHSVRDGQIAAVMIDDEATLKRVYKIGSNRIELRAENPAYPPITLIGEEAAHVRILGWAVAFLSTVK